jgi:hypothetical protein
VFSSVEMDLLLVDDDDTNGKRYLSTQSDCGGEGRCTVDEFLLATYTQSKVKLKKYIQLLMFRTTSYIEYSKLTASGFQIS